MTHSITAAEFRAGGTDLSERRRSRVSRGEVVDLVRTAKPRAELPKFGTLKDKVVIRDAGWWKPMTEAEVDRFLEERR